MWNGEEKYSNKAHICLHSFEQPLFDGSHNDKEIGDISKTLSTVVTAPPSPNCQLQKPQCYNSGLGAISQQHFINTVE